MALTRPDMARPAQRRAHDPRSRRLVSAWLWVVAVLILLMVVVGGATRLTESGLSITRWEPISGVVPPLSDADWQAEFEAYQQIPQYQRINRWMTLEDFKTIFWWEWGHRLLGRVIGVAFLVPFLIFWLTGRIERALMPRLIGLFALGGLQGVVGWWMVASGLAERTSVSQYRLAVHLTLACIILAAVVWVARSIVARPSRAVEPRRLRVTASLLLALVFLQIALGALVAGLDAGLIYNTWPLMDGAIIPSTELLLPLDPWWLNAFETIATVQFDHRMVAYLVTALALIHAFDVWRNAADRRSAITASVLLALVLGQVGLGIATLLSVVELRLALMHQAGAVVVLACAVIHRQGMVKGGEPAPARPEGEAPNRRFVASPDGSTP